jgi:Glyoxalase/Bleomycin resistance protein/Dioxygenase superfamily
MKITRIESILYGVEDLDTGIRFYQDWGLDCVDRGRHGADFALPSGQMIRIRDAKDATLPAPFEAGSSAREIVWGMQDAASLRAVAQELARDRTVKEDADGTIHSHDPNRCAIAFRVAKPAPPKASATTVPGNQAGPPVKPRRIAHVVFTVTKQQGRPTSDFYVNRLQFRITDRVLDNGDFLRASASTDHHNLFIQHRVDKLTFNHAAFEVDNFDLVMRAGKYMRDHDWKTAIEPGTHHVSSQQYWYFKNPCGGDAEYFASDVVIDDTWKTRVWETAPRVSA